MYHSEPITRNIVRKHGVSRSSTSSERNKFIEVFDKISALDASKRERERYFDFASDFFLLPRYLFGFLAFFAFFCSRYLYPRVDHYIDPILYSIVLGGIFFLPFTVSFTLLNVFEDKIMKSRKEEKYFASFSSKELHFGILKGLLGSVVIVGILSFLLSL